MVVRSGRRLPGGRRLIPAVLVTRTAAFLAAAFLVTLAFPPAGHAAAARFCNGTPIVPTGEAALSPYPSPIAVAGLSGAVTDVNVTLVGLTTGADSAGGHWADDLDVLVSAPSGANVTVMSDAGGDNVDPGSPLTGAVITLDDEAPSPLPADDHITTGTYRPTDDDDDFDELVPRHADHFEPPAPVPSHATSLSTFDGSEPGGTWALWVIDDNVTQRVESILGGWCIEITTAAAVAPPPADFDGDGDTDVSVYRPGNGSWYVHDGGITQFGTDGDIPVPGDYDGDGDADVAVFRPSSGTWFFQDGPAVAFGTHGDIPVPGDYDGDGDADVAVFRPSSGFWFVHAGPVVQYGAASDVPVPADYDGDGDSDIAVYRPESGHWFVQGHAVSAFGTAGDIALPGDYDGDGTAEPAVFRPSTGHWFVLDHGVRQFGVNGDEPVPGDYDGDGATDRAVFRPSAGIWFIDGGAVVPYGAPGDVLLPLAPGLRQSAST